MAKISRYEQTQLQSELVGTPGADTSTAQMFSTVAEGFNSAATQLRYAAAQKQREVAAANKALATAQREAEIAGLSSDYSLQLNELDNNLRATHNMNTEDALKTFSSEAAKLQEQALSNYQDDPIKLALAQKALKQAYATKQQQFSDWAATRRIPIIESQKAKVAGNLSTLFSQAPADGLDAEGNPIKDAWFDPKWVQQQVEDFGANAPMYRNLYGDNWENEMKKDLGKAFEQRISAYAMAGPSAADLEKALNDPAVKQFMKPDDILEFSGTQRRIAAEENQARALEQRNIQKGNEYKAQMAVVNMTTNGDPSTISSADFAKFQTTPDWANLPNSKKVAITAAVKKGNSPEEQKRKETQAQRDQNAYDRQQRRLNAEKSDTSLMETLNPLVVSANAEYKRLNNIFTKMQAAPNKTSPQYKAQLAMLQDLSSSFHEKASRILAMGKQFQTQSGQSWAKATISTFNYKHDKLVGMLQKSPTAAAEHAREQTAIQAITPPSPYVGDGPRTSVFNYFATQIAYDTWLQAKNRDTIINNGKVKTPDGRLVGQADYLNSEIRAKAARKTEELMGKVSRGR